MTGIDRLYKLYTQHPSVCTDTRKVEEGCIFFALKGPNFNANTFAVEALSKGAAYAVIDEPQDVEDERLLLVDDVLGTLQELAKHHRMQLNLPVIAIVGSNGKTTTKELLTSVLKQKFKVLATPGNFNNHIGLPLTLLSLNSTHEIAVIEMGANHIGENALLCNIARPDCGLVTNNGKDHLEGFGSMEGVERSNAELYEYLRANNGLIFVNAHDDSLLRRLHATDRKISYAANGDGRYIKAESEGNAISVRPEIEFTVNGEAETIHSVLSGIYNFDNIMAAVAMGAHFNVPFESIRQGIQSYMPSNNRSQVVKKEKNTLYMDAYNANPSSMEVSLRNFAAMPFDGKMAIIGDMFELGTYAAVEHSNMINLCRALGLESILVGEEFMKQNQGAFPCFATTDEAIEYLRTQQPAGKHIFMKGSRGMRLESLAAVIA